MVKNMLPGNLRRAKALPCEELLAERDTSAFRWVYYLGSGSGNPSPPHASFHQPLFPTCNLGMVVSRATSIDEMDVDQRSLWSLQKSLALPALVRESRRGCDPVDVGVADFPRLAEKENRYQAFIVKEMTERIEDFILTRPLGIKALTSPTITSRKMHRVVY